LPWFKDDTALKKIQTPVRKNVAFVSGGVFNCLIRTTVRIPSPRLYSRRQTMSAVTFTTGFNSTASKSIVNQGLLASTAANPSGRLRRRGRLARTIVVLSLSVVMVAGFAATSGANQEAPVASAAPSYSVVVVAPGETLWSVAAAYASGDVQGLINEIREVNNLKGYDLQAGQRLRVPLSQ
jgi:LysM repeat protein